MEQNKKKKSDKRFNQVLLRLACPKFRYYAPSSEGYNYALKTEFAAAVGMIRFFFITIPKLKQFQNFKALFTILLSGSKIKIHWTLTGCQNLGQTTLLTY